jgi:hypothetical protein
MPTPKASEFGKAVTPLNLELSASAEFFQWEREIDFTVRMEEVMAQAKEVFKLRPHEIQVVAPVLIGRDIYSALRDPLTPHADV